MPVLVEVAMEIRKELEEKITAATQKILMKEGLYKAVLEDWLN